MGFFVSVCSCTFGLLFILGWGLASTLGCWYTLAMVTAIVQKVLHWHIGISAYPIPSMHPVMIQALLHKVLHQYAHYTDLLAVIH